jgi:hypothetical protein
VRQQQGALLKPRGAPGQNLSWGKGRLASRTPTSGAQEGRAKGAFISSNASRNGDKRGDAPQRGKEKAEMDPSHSTDESAEPRRGRPKKKTKRLKPGLY